MTALATVDMLADNGIRLTSTAPGRYYTTCPRCSHLRQRAHQKLKCLGVTVGDDGAMFGCNHCGWTGGGRAGFEPDPIALAQARAEAEKRSRIASAERLDKAKWLWRQSVPIAGTPAERYLREARAYTGPLPATLRFLPAREKHPPAMLAPFGIPDEPEPGELAIRDDQVRGLHLTRLLPDGAGKDHRDGPAKITLGPSMGWPIVVAPVNDLGGLAITEGIEDALAAAMVGLGAWAAGSAGRLPALADAIPPYVEAVTVLVDDDTDGRRHAAALADRLRARGLEVRLVLPAYDGKVAA
jgi:hypothetical protein